MNIAPQCLPGGFNHFGHTPTFPWPDDCRILWGGMGRRENGPEQQPAFFEAHPPGTYIPSRGATIADAEARAWTRYQRQLVCPGHQWVPAGDGQKERLDGYGWCSICGRAQSKVLPVRTVCAECGETGPLHTASHCRPCYEGIPDARLGELYAGMRAMTRRLEAWYAAGCPRDPEPAESAHEEPTP